MIKVLFMIPNLGHGGAEKVLVNLVNHMDQSNFSITIMTLYDEGVNKQFVGEGIGYESCFPHSFPGVAHILKIFTPRQLYRYFVKEYYDIVVSYLEGQTARIISGCDEVNTKKICWVHRTYHSPKAVARLFRSKKEAEQCYNSFDKIVSVSEDVKKAFEQLFILKSEGTVLYNTNESERIIKASDELMENDLFARNEIKLCAMGSLIKVKGFERLISVHLKLIKENYPVHTYILGTGNEKEKLMSQITKLGVNDSVTLLGYQKNPYCYMKQCDMFVCSSYTEGFSTAVTEALILGIPVVTTNVSGMRELLGMNNEYGIITENSEDGLYYGIRELIRFPEKREYYRNKAVERGKMFQTDYTVRKVEQMLMTLKG